MLIDIWQDADNGMRVFILLLAAALCGIYGYSLFHIASYAFSANVDTGMQILLFLLGMAGLTLLGVLVVGICEPAIMIIGIVWCLVWAVVASLIKYIINRCRSHA